MLLTLPLELRRKIYRELLLDEHLPLQPQTRLITRIRTRKKIHTTILRACKQVYCEAIAVLYEENAFLYEILPFVHAYEDRKRGDELTDENFKRINHLELVIEASDYQHSEREASDIIAILGCSLRTFRITFSFIYYTKTWKGELKPVRDIIMNKVLLQSLARLDVKEKLEIIIVSDYIETYEAFKRFAINLGFLKQWAIIPDKVTNDIADDEGSARLKTYALWPRGTSWTWTLEPATGSTLASVPQSLYSGTSNRTSLPGERQQ